jgi:ankyrin repeat protein
MSSESKSHHAATPCTSRLLSLPPELFLLIVAELDCEDAATLMVCSRALAQAYVPLLATRVDDSRGSLLAGALALEFHALARALLTYGADPNLANNAPQYSLLHNAALRGNVVATRLLLEFGADVNLGSAQQQLPLHIAASSGNVELVRVLLEAGADFNSADDRGWLPMHLAAMSSRGSVQTIEVLADVGASLDAGREGEQTPLQLASLLDRIDAVRMLLSKGADVDMILPMPNGGMGFPAVFYAASRQNLEVVKTLVEAGASEYLEDMTYEAGHSGKVALLKVLLVSDKEEVRSSASVVLLKAMLEKEEKFQEMTETIQVMLDAGIVVDKTTLEAAIRLAGVTPAFASSKITGITEKLRRFLLFSDIFR